MLRLLLTLLVLSAPAIAQESVVLGLSQNRIGITANFDGSEILIFGAVKREVPTPDYAPLEVIVEVTGPPVPVTVRKKERIFGIWANKEAVHFGPAPSFYAIATTSPLNDILSGADNARYGIRIASLIPLNARENNALDLPRFRDSLIRIREKNGLYSVNENTVELTDDTLFRTRIALPSNLVEGDYKTRVFLTRSRHVIDDFETVIKVRKIGLERWIYNLAHQRPLIYGILSLTIAILAGWLASAVFRLFRLT